MLEVGSVQSANCGMIITATRKKAEAKRVFRMSQVHD